MKRVLSGIGVVILAFLLFSVSNLVLGLPATALASIETNDPQTKRVVEILGNKCASCHTPEAALPWYAGIPGASGLIEKDVRAGVSAVDLLAAMTPQGGGPVSEVFLAKLEHVLDSGAMPPGRFVLLHWNKGLGNAEVADLESWIHSVRAANYSADGVTGTYRGYVLQPLPEKVSHDPAKAELGKALYHDVRLSGDDTLSCASCHALDKGGTDQSPVATGIRGQKGPINSPTVFNSSFNLRQFWDGRAVDLKDQAGGPVTNPVEMGGNWPDVIRKLRADTAFAESFAAVYPQGIDRDSITDAIAEYEKTLVTPNSALDRYLKGDEKALTDEEKEGMDRFVEVGCATCHMGRALGGASFEKMGRRDDYFESDTKAVDRGRYNVTRRPEDYRAFKVPTLRNVALTWPYFHDARTKDLREAVRIMARVQLGVDLTEARIDSIAAFLGTLTGRYEGELLK